MKAESTAPATTSLEMSYGRLYDQEKTLLSKIRDLGGEATPGELVAAMAVRLEVVVTMIAELVTREVLKEKRRAGEFVWYSSVDDDPRGAILTQLCRAGGARSAPALARAAVVSYPMADRVLGQLVEQGAAVATGPAASRLFERAPEAAPKPAPRQPEPELLSLPESQVLLEVLAADARGKLLEPGHFRGPKTRKLAQAAESLRQRGWIQIRDGQGGGWRMLPYGRAALGQHPTCSALVFGEVWKRAADALSQPAVLRLLVRREMDMLSPPSLLTQHMGLDTTDDGSSLDGWIDHANASDLSRALVYMVFFGDEFDADPRDHGAAEDLCKALGISVPALVKKADKAVSKAAAQAPAEKPTKGGKRGKA